MSMKGGVLIVGISEDEIKQALDVHTKILGEHDDKLHELELKSIGFQDQTLIRFSHVDQTLQRMESSQTTSSTLLQNTLSTIALGQSTANQVLALDNQNGNQSIKKIKMYNITKVVLKIIAVASTIFLAYLSGRGFSINM